MVGGLRPVPDNPFSNHISNIEVSEKNCKSVAEFILNCSGITLE